MVAAVIAAAMVQAEVAARNEAQTKRNEVKRKRMGLRRLTTCRRRRKRKRTMKILIQTTKY